MSASQALGPSLSNQVSSHPSTFSYKPLSNERKDFRLLELLPPTSDRTIRCILTNCTASVNLSYNALSYEWGDSSQPQLIIVNNHEIQIRRNLHSALLQLCARGSDIKKKLFVDAICINQDDIAERNAQVSLMGDIYTNATTVIVWLGPIGAGSDDLFDLCGTHPTKVRFKRYGNVNLKLYSALEERKQRQGESILQQELETLFTRSYWKRLWIVQEVILGREVVVYCGPKCVPWEAISQLFECYVMMEDYELFTSETVRQVSRQAGGPDIWNEPPKRPLTGMEAVLYVPPIQPVSNLVLRRASTQAKTATLADLIQLHDQANCTDIHDRVYGLIGLANDCFGDNILNVDYACTAEELFYSTMAFCKGSVYAVRFGSILLDALSIRDHLPRMREQYMQDTHPQQITELRLLGKITSKCNIGHDSRAEIQDESSQMFCFDFARPGASAKRTNPIHSFEHETFLKNKHCLTQAEVEVGDRVYWIILTCHAIIFRNVGKPGSRLRKFLASDVYVPIGRAALVDHSNISAASGCLEVGLDFINRMLEFRTQVKSSENSFGYTSSMKDVLHMLQEELPLTADEYKEAERRIQLSQFRRTY